MRLWTLHPQYLDARGLVALWREALLAQAVLAGRTRGYVAHPQLLRFRDSPCPLGSISFYLQTVQAEGVRRGYRFDATKIIAIGPAEPIAVTEGQVDYEWAHLKSKLQVRAPAWCRKLELCPRPEVHPLFRVYAGPVAEWEIRRVK